MQPFPGLTKFGLLHGLVDDRDAGGQDVGAVWVRSRRTYQGNPSVSSPGVLDVHSSYTTKGYHLKGDSSVIDRLVVLGAALALTAASASARPATPGDANEALLAARQLSPTAQHWLVAELQSNPPAPVTFKATQTEAVTLRGTCVVRTSFDRSIRLVPAFKKPNGSPACITIIRPADDVARIDATAQVVILGAKVSP
jgi:hypothetical protein